MISKAIVEAIYSMEPPGRFLKKCHESGQWRELTKGEAADKAAQAMAYLVRANLKQKMKRSHSLPSSSRDKGAASSQSAHNQHLSPLTSMFIMQVTFQRPRHLHLQLVVKGEWVQMRMMMMMVITIRGRVMRCFLIIPVSSSNCFKCNNPALPSPSPHIQV